nr:hypothetical protein [Tanacetum cinerariifolium]
MTTPNITSSTDSQMHNNIMTAGEALRKCILSGPYKPTTVLVQAVDATDDSLAVPEHATVETPMNMSLENKARFLAEKEAIHLILTGIGDDIYSTVDACQTAQEMWEAIERSSAPSPKPSIPSRSHTTTRHKGKKIAKPIIPSSETASEEDSDPEQAQRDNDMQLKLALIAKYFKKIYKPTNNNLRTSSNSKNKNVDTTLQYKNDDHYGQFGNQRTIIVAAARENVGSKVVQQSGIQCFNCREFGHFVKECRKPKRLADMDEEVDEQELEAHYSYMANIQEVPTADSGTDSEPVEQVQNKAGYNVFANHLQHSEQSESVSNTCLLEKDDSNVIPDSPDMCEDDIQNEQSDVESNDERVALVNLIANLKLDVDENKKIQKQLKKANTTLAQELKECKVILAKTSKSLRESISVRDSCLVALQTKQAEFEKYKAFNDRTIDYDKRERMLNEALGQLAQKDTVIREDELESDNAEFSDMYDVILQEFVSKDVMCSYLQSLSNLDALAKLQCMYLHKVKECDCLAQKLSKQTKSVCKKVRTELLQRFAKVEKHLISLEIALQKCKEQKLIEKGKGKSVDTKFNRPYVVRQPNAQQIPKPSVLGKPAPFSNSLERIYFPKTKSVPKANVSEGLSKPVTAQTLPQTARQA